ncbi:MAG: UDP-N-acetylmuramate dehydrogenase [Ktedonobacterales bacterium]|nr:UDP-N-acetylmuramate dehydrogenase [Ktedonobacterales bacterium]
MTPLQAACVARWGDTPRLRLDEPLARHGTFGVGGPAEVWMGATAEDDLVALLALAQDHAVPILFSGNGTNVLYADAGARGVVVRVSPEDWHIREVDGAAGTARLHAGAGVSLPKLVNDLAALGWAGLEWGAGVPGTVGGGVVSNAGCHGQSISDTIQSARVLDARDPAVPTFRDLAFAELGLGYRQSRFRQHRRVPFGADGRPQAPPRALVDPTEIIVSATFLLRRDDPAAIRARAAGYRQYRKDTQPAQASAGSVFKNPPGDHAGRLVEAVGLKGHVIGGAAISPKHANFIVNQGGAKAEDIIALIALAHATVLERHGIDLELEVELRGDW